MSPVSMGVCLTDCVWMIIFLAFIGLNCIVFFSQVINSQYSTLFQYYDSQGNLCGQANTISAAFNTAYVQYTLGVTGYSFDVQCVAGCPTATGMQTSATGKSVSVSAATNQIGNLCVPDSNRNAIIQQLTSASNAGPISGIVNQLTQFGQFLPIFAVISIILTLMQVCLLKRCARAFIMVLQAVWIVGLFCLTAFGAFNFGNITFAADFLGSGSFAVGIDWAINVLFLAAGPIYLLLFICCIYSRLKIAGSIMQAGCDAFGDLPSALLIPILSVSAMVLSISFWLFVIISILGSAVTGPSTGELSFTPAVNLTPAQESLMYFTFFNLVQWVSFWGSFGQQIMCAMFTSWYYFQDGKNDLDGPPHTFGKALCRACECVGTVAIGALLITLARILQIICFLFTAEQKIADPDMGPVKKCCLCFLNCMAWLIEKIVQQFTTQGFIHSSFTGTNFCSSAFTSCSLNLQNFGIFAIVQTTETLVSTGGNLVICAINVSIAYLWFFTSNNFGIANPPWAILGVIFLSLQFINGAILEVWGLATNCVMQCFFFDQDRKGEPPTNYPFQLKDSMQEIIATKQQHDSENDSKDQEKQNLLVKN